MAIHLDRGQVDVIAEDLDIRDVLQEIFLMAGVKYDLSPEVEGTVKVNINNATYEQALKAVLGSEFTYSIGPHDIVYVHKGGETWKPGNEKVA